MPAKFSSNFRATTSQYIYSALNYKKECKIWKYGELYLCIQKLKSRKPFFLDYTFEWVQGLESVEFDPSLVVLVVVVVVVLVVITTSTYYKYL